MIARTKLRSLVTAVMLSLAACNVASAPGGAQDVVISELDVSYYYLDGNAIVVGDTGRIEIDAWTDQCVLSKCPAHVLVQVSSSDTEVVDIVTPAVTTPGETEFVARALGAATITVSAQQFARARQVYVVATPLPIDSLRLVRVVTEYDSVFDVTTDADGSVTAVSLPVDGAMAIEPLGYRDIGEVIGLVWLPWSVAATNPSVAWAAPQCRPPSVDPDCSVAEPLWIVGLSRGTSSVTVTMRNLQRTISVHVP